MDWYSYDINGIIIIYYSIIGINDYEFTVLSSGVLIYYPNVLIIYHKHMQTFKGKQGTVEIWNYNWSALLI